MGISGIGSSSSLVVQRLVTMRQQLDDLQRQFATGKKSDTYEGLGVDRGFTVGLRAQASELQAFGDTITNVDFRLKVAQSSLTRIGEISDQVRSSTILGASVDSSGSTVAQSTADSELNELLSLLNTQAGDRYPFPAPPIDTPAVETYAHITNADRTPA